MKLDIALPAEWPFGLYEYRQVTGSLVFRGFEYGERIIDIIFQGVSYISGNTSFGQNLEILNLSGEDSRFAGGSVGELIKTFGPGKNVWQLEGGMSKCLVQGESMVIRERPYEYFTPRLEDVPLPDLLSGR